MANRERMINIRLTDDEYMDYLALKEIVGMKACDLFRKWLSEQLTLRANELVEAASLSDLGILDYDPRIMDDL